MFGNIGPKPFAMPQGALPPQNLYQGPMPYNMQQGNMMQNAPMPYNPMPVPTDMMQPAAPPQQSPFGGGMSKFAPILAGVGAALTTGNASSYIPAFSGLYNSQQEQLSLQSEEQRKRAEKNKTYQYLKRTDPEAAELFASGAMSAKDALDWSRDRKKKPERKTYEDVAGFDRYQDTGELLPGQDQYLSREGVSSQIPFTPKTAPYHKELRERKEATQEDRARVDKAISAYELADRIINDPRTASVTGGIQGRIPGMLHTENQKGAQALIDELKGKVFMEAYEGLKGGGQITEFESQQALKSLFRAEQAVSDEDFKRAIQDFQSHLKKAIEAYGQSPSNRPLGGATNGTTSSGIQWSIE